MTSNDPSLTPSNSDILWHPIISSTAVVTKKSKFPRWPSITIYLFTWGSNGEMGCLNISRDTPLPLLVLTDHWAVSESFLFFGCIFYNTNRKRFTRFPDDTTYTNCFCTCTVSVWHQLYPVPSVIIPCDVAIAPSLTPHLVMYTMITASILVALEIHHTVLSPVTM